MSKFSWSIKSFQRQFSFNQFLSVVFLKFFETKANSKLEKLWIRITKFYFHINNLNT